MYRISFGSFRSCSCLRSAEMRWVGSTLSTNGIRITFHAPMMHWYSRLDTTLATSACTECTAYTSNPLLLLMAASSGIRNICRYYSPEAKHSFERIMEIIYGAKTVFTRSVITPLKVHYDCVCSRYSISISILWEYLIKSNQIKFILP